MSIKRKCYILCGDQNNDRTQFSKTILENVGFETIFFKFIPNNNKVLSNKISMAAIYELIANGEDEWVYVVEDDINILEQIKIEEIIEYENISENLFYLGVCMYPHYKTRQTLFKINNYSVESINGQVRGLHGIAMSKSGAKKILSFLENMEKYEYMDMVLEKFTELYPANIIRYDLESYIKGHRGIFFQDRKMFPSTI
jgi:hypothetical protein